MVVLVRGGRRHAHVPRGFRKCWCRGAIVVWGSSSADVAAGMLWLASCSCLGVWLGTAPVVVLCWPGWLGSGCMRLGPSVSGGWSGSSLGGSWARSVFRHGVGPLAACQKVGRGLVGSIAWVCWETLLDVGCGEAGGRLRRPVVVGGGRWLPLLVGGWLVGMLQGPGLLSSWLAVSLACGLGGSSCEGLRERSSLRCCFAPAGLRVRRCLAVWISPGCLWQYWMVPRVCCLLAGGGPARVRWG